jgi:carbon storage regulator CsrA
MLIIPRQVGEAISVGDVAITVVDIQDDTVKIGVEAPDTTGISVVRQEEIEDGANSEG